MENKYQFEYVIQTGMVYSVVEFLLYYFIKLLEIGRIVLIIIEEQQVPDLLALYAENILGEIIEQTLVEYLSLGTVDGHFELYDICILQEDALVQFYHEQVDTLVQVDDV